MRAAVEDDLGIHMHEEAALAQDAEGLRAPARAPAAAEEAVRAGCHGLREALRQAAGALAVELLLERLAQELVEFRGAEAGAVEQRVAEEGGKEALLLVGPRRRAAGAKLDPAFAGDARDGFEQALAFLHALADEFQHALEAELQRHGGELRCGGVRCESVRRRGRRTRLHDAVPRARRVEPPEFRDVARRGSAHRHIPVARLGFDFHERAVLAGGRHDLQEKLRHTAAEAGARDAHPIEIPIAKEPARVAGREEERVLVIGRGQLPEILVSRRLSPGGGDDRLRADVIFVGFVLQWLARERDIRHLERAGFLCGRRGFLRLIGRRLIEIVFAHSACELSCGAVASGAPFLRTSTPTVNHLPPSDAILLQTSDAKPFRFALKSPFHAH